MPNNVTILNTVSHPVSEGTAPTATLGAAGNNVIITRTQGNQTTNYVLNDFADYVLDYFDEGNFVAWGNETPQSGQVKIWYDTTDYSAIS